jgi:hypothetical protein
MLEKLEIPSMGARLKIYAAIEAEKKLWDSEKATAGDTKK